MFDSTKHVLIVSTDEHTVNELVEPGDIAVHGVSVVSSLLLQMSLRKSEHVMHITLKASVQVAETHFVA